MPASEVLTQILADFTANNPTLETEQLRTFCDYATTWLASKGIVGVGHTAAGIALRLADGQEILLYSPTEDMLASGPAVSITGTKSKVTQPILGDSISFPITGR